MLEVGGHALEAVHGEFFQGANVLVGFGQNAHGLGFLVVLLAGGVPIQHVELGKDDAFLVGDAVLKRVAQFQAFIDAVVDALHVEVGVGDGRKQRVVHEGMDALAEVAIVMAAAVLVMVGDDAESFEGIDQQVLCVSHLRVLSAHARQFAAGASGGFLALETKHFLVHGLCVLS